MIKKFENFNQFDIITDVENIFIEFFDNHEIIINIDNNTNKKNFICNLKFKIEYIGTKNSFWGLVESTEFINNKLKLINAGLTRIRKLHSVNISGGFVSHILEVKSPRYNIEFTICRNLKN